MRRPRTVSVTAALMTLTVLAGACGSGSDEAGIGELIEQQTGGSIDVDLSDGGFDVSSEDGSFSIDDEGNFTAVGPDGEIVTGDIDADGNSIDISSDQGDSSFQTGDSVPDEWPADVPLPEGMDVSSGATFVADGKLTVTVLGTPTPNLEDFVASYTATLVAAGFTETSRFERPGAFSGLYENAGWEVSLGGGESAGITSMTIAVTEKG